MTATKGANTTEKHTEQPLSSSTTKEVKQWFELKQLELRRINDEITSELLIAQNENRILKQKSEEQLNMLETFQSQYQDLLHRHEMTLEEKRELHNQIEILVHQLDQSIENSTTSQDNVRNESKTLVEKVEEITRKFEQQKERNKTLKNLFDNSEQLLAEYRADLEIQEQRIAQLAEERENDAQLFSERRSREKKEYELQIHRLRSDINALSAIIQTQRREIAEVRDNMDTVKRKRDEYEKLYHDLKADFERRAKEQAVEIQNLTIQTESCGEQNRMLRSEMDSIKKDYSQREEQYSNTVKQIQEVLNNEKKEHEHIVSQLNNQLIEIQNSMKLLQSENETRNHIISELQVERDEFKEEFRISIEEQSRLARESEAQNRLVLELRQGLDREKQRHLILIQSMEEKHIQEQMEQSKRLETELEQLTRVYENKIDSVRKTLEDETSSLKKQKDILSSELEQYHQKLEQTENERNQVESMLNEARITIESTKEAYEEVQSQLLEHQRHHEIVIHGLNTKIQNIQKKSESDLMELEQLRRLVESLQTQNDILRKEHEVVISDMRKEIENTKKESSKFEQLYVELLEKQDVLSNISEQSKKAADLLLSENASLSSTIETQQKEIANMKKNIEQLRRRRDEWENMYQDSLSCLNHDKQEDNTGELLKNHHTLEGEKQNLQMLLESMQQDYDKHNYQMKLDIERLQNSLEEKERDITNLMDSKEKIILENEDLKRKMDIIKNQAELVSLAGEKIKLFMQEEGGDKDSTSVLHEELTLRNLKINELRLTIAELERKEFERIEAFKILESNLMTEKSLNADLKMENSKLTSDLSSLQTDKRELEQYLKEQAEFQPKLVEDQDSERYLQLIRQKEEADKTVRIYEDRIRSLKQGMLREKHLLLSQTEQFADDLTLVQKVVNQMKVELENAKDDTLKEYRNYYEKAESMKRGYQDELERATDEIRRLREQVSKLDMISNFISFKRTTLSERGCLQGDAAEILEDLGRLVSNLQLHSLTSRLGLVNSFIRSSTPVVLASINSNNSSIDYGDSEEESLMEHYSDILNHRRETFTPDTSFVGRSSFLSFTEKSGESGNRDTLNIPSRRRIWKRSTTSSASTNNPTSANSSEKFVPDNIEPSRKSETMTQLSSDTQP